MLPGASMEIFIDGQRTDSVPQVQLMIRSAKPPLLTPLKLRYYSTTNMFYTGVTLALGSVVSQNLYSHVRHVSTDSFTMQNVNGPIRISHLYRTFFFFIFSWPYYVLPTPKFKQINNKSQTVMLTAATQSIYISIY